VYDFRAADVSAGGQGAPLVPAYHRALVSALDRPHPVAVLNVGGVANITYIDGERDPIACDTGPGNALIDDFMRERTGEIVDRDGRAAAAGRVDEGVVARALAHDYFQIRPPKSLDRNEFSLGDLGIANFSMTDGAATLTALTAGAIARVIDHLPRRPATWMVTGGGARNPTLLRMLSERLGPAAVATAVDVGWSADALEAQAFAYLAVRSIKGLPITFPSTTGAPRPLCGGIFVTP
jgi:anhydro-N-acetylmuramic acid kinase